MTRHTPLSLALLMLAGPVHAVSDAELQACAAVVDLSQRLACYDALARRQPADAKPEPQSTTPAATPAPTQSASSAPAVSAVEMAFGAETLDRNIDADIAIKAANLDMISSRIAGDFNGWERGTLFRLQNGQVWKCVDINKSDFIAQSPGVTIERGVFGSYWFRVEGQDKRASVRRVE
jgi:hypothetical protein